MVRIEIFCITGDELALVMQGRCPDQGIGCADFMFLSELDTEIGHLGRNITEFKMPEKLAELRLVGLIFCTYENLNLRNETDETLVIQL